MSKQKFSENYATGKYVNLRDVEIGDSEFILSLRCDENKSKYLHKTEYDVEKQQNYIKHYKTLDNEYYFIITDKNNTPIGTIRMYDMKKDTFVSGSWLMKENSLPEEVLEGNYLMLNFAHCGLKYEHFKFEVQKQNTKVIRFHKMMGAEIVNENEVEYFFEASLPIYLGNMKKILN